MDIFFVTKVGLLCFGGLQLYFGSYANHLYLFGMIDFVPCTSSDRESKVDELWSTIALIYVNNGQFAITVSKLENYLIPLTRVMSCDSSTFIRCTPILIYEVIVSPKI